MINKLPFDYINCLRDSRFISLLEMIELGVCKKYILVDELFFKPVDDIPLSLEIAISK